MRISSVKTDQGYPLYQSMLTSGLKINITVDGVAYNGVITADEERGFIRRYTDTINSGQYETEILNGHVVIHAVTQGPEH